MGIKGVVCDVYEACIEACRNVGRRVGTLPKWFKGIHDLSVDPCTREEINEEVITQQESIGEEIIEEEMCAKSATNGAASCSQVLKYNVKKSTEHWTKMLPKFTVDRTLLSANSKRFKHLMKRWQGSKSKHGFFVDYGELLKMGNKIADGGQFEIIDARFEGDSSRFVLKVFKDARLEDLERLWPPPLLPLLYVDYEPDWMREDQHCCWIRGGTLLKDGRFAFLMDKFEDDLRSYINQKMRNQINGKGPFELKKVVKIMQDIAKGMQSLHMHGILHRDLKASNVLIQYNNGGYVVANFETSMGVLGTGFWRAPEVLLALKTRTLKPEIWMEEVDVYSYAMTCYEIMTGHIPFEDHRQDDYDFVLKGGRPPVPCWYWEKDSWDDHLCGDWDFRHRIYSFPIPQGFRYRIEGLDDLLERCWHPNPRKRPSFKMISSILDDVHRLSHSVDGR